MGKRKETEAGLGHNSEGADAEGIAQDQLKSLVERIERLEEEKADIQSDIKDVYAEAKGQGHNVKALRKFVARRKRDRDELAEEDALLEIYEGIFN